MTVLGGCCSRCCGSRGLRECGVREDIGGGGRRRKREVIRLLVKDEGSGVRAVRRSFVFLLAVLSERRQSIDARYVTAIRRAGDESIGAREGAASPTEMRFGEASRATSDVHLREKTVSHFQLILKSLKRTASSRKPGGA